MKNQQSSIALICGTDEFSVKQRAKSLYNQWVKEIGGIDHEIIDAAVSNSSEALKAIARLRESLQTLSLFGSGKVVWLQNCSFLGDERAASAQSVSDSLNDLAQELKTLPWDSLRLIVSAGKPDKRKVFFKTLDKLGSVETFDALSTDDRDWAEQAETLARSAFKARGKAVSDEAIAEFVAQVGPNTRQIENEAEKLSLYAGDRIEISVEDVRLLSTHNKSARAFALGDALGDRDLPRLLRRLDEELWEVKLDPQKSTIGLLYGLISKIRAMLMLKEMTREGWISPEADYPRFKSQLGRVPTEQLPTDKRFNPLALNPYVLYKALPQVKRYSESELVEAMDLLLQCNQRLVSSSLEESLVLQQTLARIVQGADQWQKS